MKKKLILLLSLAATQLHGAATEEGPRSILKKRGSPFSSSTGEKSTVSFALPAETWTEERARRIAEGTLKRWHPTMRKGPVPVTTTRSSEPEGTAERLEKLRARFAKKQTFTQQQEEEVAPTAEGALPKRRQPTMRKSPVPVTTTRSTEPEGFAAERLEKLRARLAKKQTFTQQQEEEVAPTAAAPMQSASGWSRLQLNIDSYKDLAKGTEPERRSLLNKFKNDPELMQGLRHGYYHLGDARAETIMAKLGLLED